MFRWIYHGGVVIFYLFVCWLVLLNSYQTYFIDAVRVITDVFVSHNTKQNWNTVVLNYWWISTDILKSSYKIFISHLNGMAWHDMNGSVEFEQKRIFLLRFFPHSTLLLDDVEFFMVFAYKLCCERLLSFDMLHFLLLGNGLINNNNKSTIKIE